MNATDIRDTADMDDREWKEQYEESLDETFGEAEIAGLKYCTSFVLKEIDHTAYLCGFADWLDGISDPWQCGDCKERYETEEEAEECCQE